MKLRFTRERFRKACGFNKEEIMTRTIVVGPDFPMKLGDVLRIRGVGELLEYFVTAQIDKDQRKWEARVTRRAPGTNKEPIMRRGDHEIQKLRDNRFPTPEEIYKRMERGNDDQGI